MPTDADHPACPYPSHPPPVKVAMVTLGDGPCSYLPGRASTSRAFWAQGIEPAAYQQFMDAGFRRSGRVLYQPVCAGCRACLPIRIPAAQFVPSKSQRRCWRRNQDLLVTVAEPAPSEEKYALYQRYLTEWHQRPPGDDDSRQAFESFLYNSPTQTFEFCYRDPAGNLLGVGICDRCPAALSSVYFYHDPSEHRRGLGTFGVLFELVHARQLDIPWYYLGFWVAGCAAMEYKSSFQPCEVLHPDGLWRPAPFPRRTEPS